MTRLDDLIAQIESEFSVARSLSSRAALYYLQRSYEAGDDVAMSDLRQLLRTQPGYFRVDPRRLQALSEYSFSAIKDIETIGRERVRDVMRRAVDDASLDVSDITRLLKSELYDVVEDYRIPIIARTETNRFGNAAKADRYKATGITHHQALTAEDDRVRTFDTSGEDHTAINGQVVKVGEPFSIPRIRGGPNDNGDRYPPFAPNCRCTVVPVIPQDGEVRSAALAAVSLAPGRQGERLRAWKRILDAYAEAMRLDMQRHWRNAFQRVDAYIAVHAQSALNEARNSRS